MHDDGRVTPEAFAAALRRAVFDAAVHDVLTTLDQGAPGRGPHPRADAMTGWYGELSEDDRTMVTEVVREAAHAAVFGTLCVLDGVRTVDDPPHATLVLTAVSDDGAVSTLSSQDAECELHDLFNGEVHPPTEPWPGVSG